jgi:hypothetical protein
VTAALWRFLRLWLRLDFALRRCVRVHCRASIALAIFLDAIQRRTHFL